MSIAGVNSKNKKTEKQVIASSNYLLILIKHVKDTHPEAKKFTINVCIALKYFDFIVGVFGKSVGIIGVLSLSIISSLSIT